MILDIEAAIGWISQSGIGVVEPGLTADEEQELVLAFPRLPATYLAVARRLSLIDLEFAAVRFYVGMRCHRLIEQLDEGTSMDVMPEKARADWLYVGDINDDPVFVELEGGPAPGRVFWSYHDVWRPIEICASFADLLVLGTRLGQVMLGELSVKEFSIGIGGLGLGRAATDWWIAVAEGLED